MYIRDEVLAEVAGKLCELAIYTVVSYAEKALIEKEITLSAFIDV